MTQKAISLRKKPHWFIRWSLVMLVTLYFCTAWAIHGNYEATRVWVRITTYISALYVCVVCVRFVLLLVKDHPIQIKLAVAAITLVVASYFVANSLAFAGYGLAIVVALTSASARRMFVDLRESYRRISATTKQL